MTSDRGRTVSPAGLCRADLAAARGFEPSYDSGRGAARLSAALAVAGAASSVATASATSAITKGGVGHGLAAKAITLLALSGAVLTSDAPQRGAPTVEAPALVAVATGARVFQAAPGAEARAPRAETEAPTPSATPTTEPQASARAAARPSPAPTAKKRAPNGFGREVADVTRARALLSADPSAALAAAERSGGSQALAEEREIIAIRALVSLGRATEAKARASDFVARRPQSPFAATARALAAE